MTKWRVLLGAALLPLGMGCSEGHGTLAGGVGPTSSGAAGSGGATGPEALPPPWNEITGDPPDLFSIDHVPQFDFVLADEDWESILANPLAERYVPATVSFDGALLGDVGLRFKGNYGTLDSCVDEQNRITCPKLSMKVRFDEFYAGQRFYGLKRLNFHSMVWDRSKLRERIAYDLYREMGVHAPLSAWAVLSINGESKGLFSMVEQVDGRFTDHRWPGNGDGNLYKEVWPIASSSVYYQRYLENNDETASHAGFIAFHEALDAAGGDPAPLRQALAGSADVDALHRYLAVDDAIVNCDGVTTIYTADDRGWTSNHNFYWYEEENRPFFWLVPWDLDATLSPSRAQTQVPHWTMVPDDCSLSYTVFSGQAFVVAPGCDPVFRALSADLGTYRDAVDELLSGPFGEAVLSSKIESLVSFISDAVAADPLGATLEVWRSEVDRLKRDLPVLRARLEALRDGRTIQRFALRLGAANDFDAYQALDLSLSAAIYTNPNSLAEIGLAADAASSDRAQVLRVDFDYRNEVEPWGQYAVLVLPVAEDSTDLTSVAGVRLWARSDRARELRVDLVSPVVGADDEVRQGWDVDVGANWQLVELLFADAAVPDWASEPPEPLSTLRADVRELYFMPRCEGRDSEGQLPEGSSDVGWMEIDGIEFFAR